MIASLTLKDFSRPDSLRNAKNGVGAQTALQNAFQTGRDDRVKGSLKLPFLDLSKACANVSWESAIDGYAGHTVGWMPEPLEIGFRFSHTLEGCRIAGLHIDADDVPHIVDHRVQQPAVSVLHTGLLNVREEDGWGWLPGVLFLGHDACGVVVSEGSFGKLGVA